MLDVEQSFVVFSLIRLLTGFFGDILKKFQDDNHFGYFELRKSSASCLCFLDINYGPENVGNVVSDCKSSQRKEGMSIVKSDSQN